MKVAEDLQRQGKPKEAEKYRKEARKYLPFYKRITGNLIFRA